METKRPTSVRLTEEAKRLLAALAKKLGVSQAAVLEIAVREKARREGVKSPTLAQQRRIAHDLPSFDAVHRDGTDGLYDALGSERAVSDCAPDRYLRDHPELTLRIREAIRTSQVVTDMTRLDMMAAWGPPASCRRTLGSHDTRTVCLYKDVTRSQILDRRYTDVSYKSVLFEDSIVTDWQQH